MKFCLMSQCEIAYLKNNKNEIVRKFFAPKGMFFIPGVWEFEDFPKDFYLKTWDSKDLQVYLKSQNYDQQAE